MSMRGLHQDIYVRAHTRPIDQHERPPLPRKEPKWSDYALIFDCESRVTPDQSLTFGFWRFCELRDGEYVVLEEGIFHDDGLSPKEITLLRKFARRKPETAGNACDCIRVYSRSKFIMEVLGIAIQAHAFIVLFNAGFDLSRIALDWETAENGGWSLIFSQRRDPKTGQLKPTKCFPRIVIKALNSKTSIIHSTRPPLCEPRTEGEKVKHWPEQDSWTCGLCFGRFAIDRIRWHLPARNSKRDIKKSITNLQGESHLKKSNMPGAMSHALPIC